jgi:AcrR family transcriptional regulator
MREIKDPEVRKKQIMSAAIKLFNEYGYEKTSVNKVIESIDIAKGTFYHYFPSKEELLIKIIDDFYSGFIEEIIHLSETTSLNPFEKMKIILKKLIQPGNEQNPFAGYIDDDRTNKIHSVSEERFRFHFHPILTHVLKEGIDANIFAIDFPEEISEILLIGIQGYLHNHLPRFTDPAYAVKKMKAIEEIFNKVLKNEIGIFSLMD